MWEKVERTEIAVKRFFDTKGKHPQDMVMRYPAKGKIAYDDWLKIDKDGYAVVAVDFKDILASTMQCIDF